MSLTEQESLLLQKAKKASQNAYAPYSSFHVGAAILTDRGNIYESANIENASYSLTICAERNAAAKAVFQNDLNFILIAIYVDSDKIFPPCGACRQFLAEFTPNVTIIYGNKNQLIKTNLGELLPSQFQLNEKR